MKDPTSSNLPLLQPDVRTRRRVINAVYHHGALQPSESLALEEGTTLLIRVLPVGEARAYPEPLASVVVPSCESQSSQSQEARTTRSGTLAGPCAHSTVAGISSETLAWILFGLGMLVYLFTRLWKITEFPIYFFADEAVHSVLAGELLGRGFRDAGGRAFPLYFEAAGNRWTPLLSVYVHAISVGLAGKSIVVNRATTALMSLLAAGSVALILRQVFKARHWWVGALLLAVAPAWFLHSRTGFETVMMSSFFACFLLFYLLYRTSSPRYLFVAMIFGALAFYTYSAGQMMMISAGVLLAVSDIRYHLKHWRTTLPGLVLIGLLALPMLHFRALNPQFITTTLRTMDSYWFHDLTLAQKIGQFIRTWAEGVSPAYWFLPSQTLLVRHRMEGYGNLSVWLLPFFLVGAGWCLWKIKSPAPRAVILMAAVTPMSAALVEDVGITRVLAFTIPASLLIALGLETTLDLLDRRFHLRYAVVAVVVFGCLSVASLGMLRDALVNGPLWYGDYGLYGMQYGAKQLFQEAVPEMLAADPNDRIMMTSSWANGADTFIRFFLPKELQSRVQMLSIDFYMDERRNLDANTILVMTPAEYERARTSPKFCHVSVERIIPYPDGSPGFYFARLEYSPDFEKLLAPEREARIRPVDEAFTLNGQQVVITHSPLDAGRLADLLDGDTFTLVRGLAANPLIFDFRFSRPRAIDGLAADFGSMDFRLTSSLYASEGSEPTVYQETYRGLPSDPHVEMLFPEAPESVARFRIEIEQLNAPPDPHIHVRELAFRPTDSKEMAR